MEVRLLGLGLFQKRSGYQAPFLSIPQITQIFGEETLLEFSPKLEYKNQTYNEGYFDVISVTTSFSKNKSNLGLSKKVINIQPTFFVFQIPFPWIHCTYRRYDLNKINKYIRNTFYTYNSNTVRDKTANLFYSTTKLQSELEGTISLGASLESNLLQEKKFINNFFRNNSHFLFIETIEEIAALMSSYDGFVKEVFGLSLDISSFSKIVIPFFELSEEKLKEVFSDDDPFDLPF